MRVDPLSATLSPQSLQKPLLRLPARLARGLRSLSSGLPTSRATARWARARPADASQAVRWQTAERARRGGPGPGRLADLSRSARRGPAGVLMLRRCGHPASVPASRHPGSARGTQIPGGRRVTASTRTGQPVTPGSKGTPSNPRRAAGRCRFANQRETSCCPAESMLTANAWHARSGLRRGWSHLGSMATDGESHGDGRERAGAGPSEAWTCR